mmetsp:Transcript_6658/g.17285  ORF Transcript_6658/g.17285 Transcript_6658/m.17285 type:complete len:309 (+) Transcript_6658:498-1424(+)
MARIRLRRHHWGVPASTRGCLSASPAALRPPRWQRTPSFWRQRQCPLLDSTVVGKPVHGLLNVHRQPQPPLLDVSNRMTACTRLLACADCLDTCAVYRGVVRVTPHGLLELRQQIRLPCSSSDLRCELSWSKWLCMPPTEHPTCRNVAETPPGCPPSPRSSPPPEGWQRFSMQCCRWLCKPPSGRVRCPRGGASAAWRPPAPPVAPRPPGRPLLLVPRRQLRCMPPSAQLPAPCVCASASGHAPVRGLSSPHPPAALPAHPPPPQLTRPCPPRQGRRAALHGLSANPSPLAASAAPPSPLARRVRRCR